MPLCLEKMLDVISVFLNLLRLVLWSNMWPILENAALALEKVCILQFLDKMF